MDIISFNRDPSTDMEYAIKYIKDSLDKRTLLGFDQTLENHFGVSVGDTVYNLVEYDKLHFTDETIMKYLNVG